MAKPEEQGRQSQPTEVFQGFSSPNYTQVPDTIFDQLLPDLSEAELKVLLYVVRRTFGFKKDADTISLRQLSSGITTREGKVLDRGTGLSKSGVTKALVSLRKKGILIRYRNSDSVRGSTPTTYRLRMLGDPLDSGDEVPDVGAHPLSTLEDTPVHGGSPPLSTTGYMPDHGENSPLSTSADTQETVEQQTEIQERAVENSTRTDPDFDEIGARMLLLPFVEDFAREFNDQAPLRSSVSRMVNLFRKSEMDEDEFIDVMYQARNRTKEYSASIRAEAAGAAAWKTKAKMAYFYSIVTDMVGAKAGEGE